MMRANQLSEKLPALGYQHRRLLIALAVLAFGAIYGFSLTTQAIPVMALLGAPIAVVAAVVLFFKPEIGTVLLVGLAWGFLSEIGTKYYGLPSITKPLVGLLAVSLVLRRFTGKRQPLVYDNTTWWMVAYWLVIAFGMWHAGNLDRTGARVEDFAKDIVLYLLIINLLVSPKSYERTMWLLLIIGAVLGTITLYQELTHTYSNNYGGLARIKMAFITDEVGSRPRASGTTGEPLVYGQQLLVLMPIGLWGAIYARSLPMKVFSIYATIACMIGIVLSFSRSSYIAMIAVLLLFAFHIHVNWRYMLLVGLLAAGLWQLAPIEFKARLGTLEDLLPGTNSQGVNSEGSFRGRSSEMMMAIYMFRDNPLIGVGAGNYRDLYPEYIREYGSPVNDEERNAHSFYLEVAAEHGIIGLFVFGGILVMAWSRFGFARRTFMAAGNERMAALASALQVGFGGYLISAIFYHGGYPSYLWLQIGWAVALAVIARRSIATAAAPARQAADVSAPAFAR